MSTDVTTFVSRDIYARAQSDVHEIGAKLDNTALEVIAREVLRRVAGKAEITNQNKHLATREKLERFCVDLLSSDQNAGLNYISQIRADGASITTVYLSYLAGAAQLLGEWWDDDRVSFVDVTIGSSRIYAIMCALNAQATATGAPPSADRAVLFASVPGETHTLGVKAAADLMEQRGWLVSLSIGRSHDELIQDIVSSDAPIVGLSAAGARALPELAKLIISLRIDAPAKKIIVGGNVLMKAGEEICAMKPDAVALDMPQAYLALERLRRRIHAEGGDGATAP